MNWDALAAVAELLAAIAVVASLVYLAIQVRQNTRQARLAAQQATIHELGHALRAQAQDREWAALLAKALQDLDALDAVERVQFLSHVGSIFRVYESAYLHMREGTLDPRFWRGFERAIADVIGYPGMRAAFELRKHHLTDEFAAYLDGLAGSTVPRPIFAEPSVMRLSETASPGESEED
jgi:hypothetical protein